MKTKYLEVMGVHQNTPNLIERNGAEFLEVVSTIKEFAKRLKFKNRSGIKAISYRRCDENFKPLSKYFNIIS